MTCSLLKLPQLDSAQKLDLKKSVSEYHSKKEQVESVQESNNKTQITYSIGTARKNILKGELGEKLAGLMQGKLATFLDASLGERWDDFGWEMNLVNPNYKIGNMTADDSEIKVVPRSGPVQMFYLSDKSEIRCTAKSRCVIANKDLLRHYNSINPSSVDKKYYAVEYTGQTEKIEFESSASTNTGEHEDKEVANVELPVISDFRILAVEIKTTVSNGKYKLSEKQRMAENTATKSERLQFYTMKIPISFGEFSIPDRVNIELERLS